MKKTYKKVKRLGESAPAIGSQQDIVETEIHGSMLDFDQLQEILPGLLQRIGVMVVCREVFEHGRGLDRSFRVEDENYRLEQVKNDIPLYPEKMTHLQDPGEYRVYMGRKYRGLKLKDIPIRDMVDYLSWLEENANRKGVPVSEEAQFLRVAFDRYRKFQMEKRK